MHVNQLARVYCHIDLAVLRETESGLERILLISFKYVRHPFVICGAAQYCPSSQESKSTALLLAQSQYDPDYVRPTSVSHSPHGTSR
jgi:hypothetical protein